MTRDDQINQDWINTAIQAAKLASKAIMEIYATDFSVNYKDDRSPVTIADQTSSTILLTELKKTGVPIISEEEEIEPFEQRKHHPFIWIIDPIDGTKEFIRKNGEFCICIALVHNSKSVFGLLASPTEQKILIGGQHMGAYYFDFKTPNYLDESFKVPPLTIPSIKTIAYSRSHFSEAAEKIIQSITEKHGGANFIKKGSALKFIDLALGKAQFYPRLAPTMEWDIAAGQAIYESVGGEVLDFTNFEPLRYNKEDLYNPFFIAKNKDLKI